VRFAPALDDRRRPHGVLVPALPAGTVKRRVLGAPPNRATIRPVASRPQLARIARKLETDADLFARLAALQSSDLRAVLLEIAARRAAATRPADILRRYEGSAPFQPARVAAAPHRALETWAMDQLPDGFVELALAPTAPLGASAVLGGFSQDRVLTTIADSEVVSDSTNVLALECARRRRPLDCRRQPPTRLAAACRMVRPRNGLHFGLLALCTAGRDRGSFAFQLEAISEQLKWHIRVITGFAPHLRLQILLTDLSGGAHRSALGEALLSPKQAAWPAIEWGFDDDRVAGRDYYSDACFAVNALCSDGSRANLSDGGLTDWTARLLADQKERLLISGLGSERLMSVAAAEPPSPAA
jgi:hypothetical protein